MTSTKASTPADIKTALTDVSIPDFAEPEYALSLTIFDPVSETTETREAWPGDIIEHNPPASSINNYYVVIDLTNTDLIYYIPGKHRFSVYPREFLEEDISNGIVAYHTQILELD